MELIKIYNGSLLDARELHKFLEIKTDFRKWVQRNLIKYFEEGKEFRSKMTETSQRGGRPQKDYYLTLDTAKKLAMMAKTSKGEEARNYFLECEKTIIALKQNKRLEAFLKLETSKGRLEKNVLDLGGTHDNYIQIDTAGRKVLFNGQLIPDEELHELALKGRDFATALTNDILSKENYLLEDVEEINKEQHRTIRNVIINNTKRKPEDLPKEQRIKKLGE